MKTFFVMVAAVLVLAACGGDDETEQAPVNLAELAPESLGACDDLPGMDTSKVIEVGLCDDGETDAILMSAFYECVDGSKLYWNDYGWGYSDGRWQAHGKRSDGQLIPPEADMAECRQ